MAEIKVAEVEITQPPPESGVVDTLYKIEGTVKLFDTLGAPPWIYAEAKLKSWLRPEVLEETTYSRGFPIPVTGKFSIGWTPKKEGTYEVTVVATPAPLPLPVIGVPPIIGKSDVMEVAVRLTVWEMVEEILGIVIGAGPEASAWIMEEEILDIVVEAGPEVSAWIMEEEVPGIVIGAGPEVSIWLMVEEVPGIVVEAGPEVSIWLMVEEVSGIVVEAGPKPEADVWVMVEEVSGITVGVAPITPPAEYTLEITIEPPGTGSVLVEPPFKPLYSHGEVVTLTAYPESGYEFDHWGGWPPYPGVGSTSPTIQITMDANWWVVAAFREAVVAPTTVQVDLKNPPSGATKWQMRVVDWDITQTISWGTKEQDNIGESPIFDIPSGWKFPLRIGIQIYRKINGSQQLYTVQSYRPYKWDFDINDWGTEPDPTYRKIFIPSSGSYYYNVATEQFEKI